MSIEAIKFNTQNLMTSPLMQKQDNAQGLIFGDNLIGSNEDKFENDGAKKQISIQAQELIRLAKNLNPENKDSVMKKVIANKMKALKEMAEASGVDVNKVFSEVMANMSRSEQKKISKTLKVKISKVQPKAEGSQTDIINPFKNNFFGGFGNLTTSAKAPSSWNTRTDLPELENSGYNAEKAKKLANSVIDGAGNRSQSYCAKYVSDAMARAGIGSDRGHAYQMAEILADNKNFNEVDTKGMDLSKLPAGCIVVWDKGAAGYSSQYGHIAVTLGDGRAASDFIQQKIPQSDRARVYVPV